MSDEIQEVSVVTVDIMPRNIGAEIAKAVQMRDALDMLFEQLLEPKVDYDRIPGTDKPTLLKPGAEILCRVFKLAQGKADILDRNEDFEKGIFSYVVGMPLIHIESGAQVAYGIGSANSYERKYRYRKDSKGNTVENADPADLQNTLIKMANKRAFIDAVLKATAASRKFTQDMEDLTGGIETASSKQVDLIKKLFGKVTEDDMLTEISQICGREITDLKDVLRSEASLVIDAKKPKPAAATAKNDGSGHACSECGATITAAEDRYSNSTFGKPLCRACQAKAKAAAS
ncbi:hypothetical protein [Mahella australiensis]|uniref:Uncharacterized protein n=1 Tax=Mahella australiensis (strain DSM 15567 / CIP 107919 / 50-1 BON) TaxID=697281 RepID=F4A0X1_MAHA5|nr:hypothetical protein [Mahella australiensis]AEE98048.1 hypothetical protein Mahau_2927 [Mahella australiensis 50-1 BON]